MTELNAILFHDILEDRPSFPVPSIHHQTLLSKSIFEHCIMYSEIAAIAMASKSIQNSSLSANLAGNVKIQNESIKLFVTVFHPATSIPIQFLQHLSLDSSGSIDVAQSEMIVKEFLSALTKTEY